MTAIPGAPGLGTAGREAYAEAEAVLVEAGRPPMRAALRRYARAVDAAEAAWRDWRRAKRSTVDGRHGGMHPALRAAQAAELDAAKFAERLGLDFEAPRRPVGRPPGSVSAPDRKTPPPRITRR